MRPLPQIIPGLQLSYLGVFGKGNSAQAPDYNANAGIISYETNRLVLTGTYYNGVGDIDGQTTDNFGKSLDQNGYSIFTEVKLGESNVNLFGRYDFFKTDDGFNTEKKSYIVGISYDFIKDSKILFDYDNSESNIPGTPKNYFYEIAIELAY